MPELEYHIRVLTTVDGALFDAHEASRYTRSKEGSGLRFVHYPGTNALYIELNPGRERKLGGTQEVVGWGDHDIVIS